MIAAQVVEPHYGEDMADLPDWMRPPREEGWFAEDLDRLPEAPRHTELIDGALVFMMAPQRSWHGRIVDTRNRPEADVLVTTAPFDPDRTWFEPDDVPLVVEVVPPSPPSATAR